MTDGNDPAPLNPDICGDADGDTCDDCTFGTDDLGPLPDNDPSNDGPDTDGDGICDAGDPSPLDNPDDPDGDGVCTTDDNCNLPNPTQSDCQPNGVGDVCDIASGTSSDNDGNGIPDECDVQAPLGEDSFGDVVGGTAGMPPDGFRNFKDISAVVRGFQSTQTEPKVWLDLQGGTATPETPDFSDINFADINHAVSGFQGGGYPFDDPCTCVGLPPCP